MANDAVDQWVQMRIRNRMARGVVNPPPSPGTPIKPTTKLQTSKEMGLAGRIGSGIQKATDFVYSLPGPVGSFYKGAAGVTGNTLNALNKVAIDPMRHFVAGGTEQIQKTWKDPNMNVVEKTIRSTPQAAAIAGIRNAAGEKKTFGNGVDITAGALPNKRLISEEQGTMWDNPVKDVLFGKGTFGKTVSAFSNPNWAANFAADVATPGIPIGTVLKPTIKGIAASDKVQKAGKAVGKFIEDRPKLAGAVEAIRPGTIYPEAEKAVKTARVNERVRQARLETLLRESTGDLTPDEIGELADIIEKKVVSGNEKLNGIAKQITAASDEIGGEAVSLGNMTQESFDKFKGEYMSHIPERTIESLGDDGALRQFRSGSFVGGTQAGSFKKRTGALEEYSRQVPAVAQLSLGQEIQANERTRALDRIVGAYGVKGEATANKTVKLSSLPTLPQPLKEKYKDVTLPVVVAEKVSQAYARQQPGLGDKLINLWKSFKTTQAGTPAYFIRNQKSNIYQSSIETGRNLAEAGADNMASMAELLGVKAGDMNLLREFNEVSDMSSNVDRAKRLLLKKNLEYSGNVLRPGDFQRLQEASAKYSIYKHYRSKGTDPLSAWERANAAIFSPHGVSGTEKGLMKFAIPFYQWQRQEIPYFFKTYADHPERYALYTKTKEHVERLSEEPKTKPPSYYQGQIRLPVKDQYGDSLYLDETYSLPFGSFVKGAGENDMPFGFNPNPVFDVAPILRNQHPEFGTPLSKSSDEGEVNAAKARQLAETFGPNAVREFTTNLPAALKGEDEPYTGKQRSIRQWIYKQLGTKIAGYSDKKQSQMNEFAIKDLEKKHKSYLYSLQDKRRRGVLDETSYRDKYQKEMESFNKKRRELLNR